MDRLAGERSDVMLPIPFSAIDRYANRMGLSSVFTGLVMAYDAFQMSISSNKGEPKKDLIVGK